MFFGEMKIWCFWSSLDVYWSGRVLLITPPPLDVIFDGNVIFLRLSYIDSISRRDVNMGAVGRLPSLRLDETALNFKENISSAPPPFEETF